ncbi:hypothetical protein EV121DRAFT_298120 [Schizophyllum commune]
MLSAFAPFDPLKSGSPLCPPSNLVKSRSLPSPRPPRSERVPLSPTRSMQPPFHMSVAPPTPLGVEAMYRRPASEALLHPSLLLPPSDDVRAPLGDAQEPPSSPRHSLHSRLQLQHVARALSEPTSLRWPLLSSQTLGMLAFALLDAFQPLGKG